MKLPILLFLIMSMVFWRSSKAQYLNAFGVSIDMVDQNVELLNNKWSAFDSSLATKTRLFYQRNLSPSWNLQLGTSIGKYRNLNITEVNESDATVWGTDFRMMLKLNNGRLIKEDAMIGPFLFGGYEVQYFPSLINTQATTLWNLNYGAGFNLRFSDKIQGQLTSSMGQRLSDNFNTSLVHTIGVMYTFGERPVKTKSTPELMDSDGDGIADVNDKCPKLSGREELYGCPDNTSLAQALNPVFEEEADETSKLDPNQPAIEEDIPLLIDNNDVVLEESEEGETEDKQVEFVELEIDSVQYAKNQEEIARREAERKRLEENQSREVTEERIEPGIIDADQNPAFTDKPFEVEQPDVVFNESDYSGQEEEESKPLFIEESVVFDIDNTVGTDENASTIEEDPNPVVVSVPVNNNPTSPRNNSTTETTTATDHQQYLYYVVTMSTPTNQLAKKWKRKIEKEFLNAGVKLYQLNNGYQRVGLYQTRNKAEAFMRMEELRSLGHPNAWVAKQPI